MKHHPSAELQLLLKCCFEQLHPEPVAFRNFLADHPVDWDRFVETTSKHKLLPLVNNLLKEHPEIVPLKIREWIAVSSGKLLKRTMLLAGELGRVHQLLDNKGIRYLALKGPVMIRQLYGDYRSRQTRDLDILVEEENLEEAISVLSKAGYIFLDRYFTKDPGKKKLYMARENHVRFRHPEMMLFIELHWSVSKYYTTIPVKSLFQNAVEFEHHGHTYLTLTPEVYFVVLAIHGIYHRFEHLFWLYDLAHILNINGINTKEIMKTARIFKCSMAVRVSMALAMNMFDNLNATAFPSLALTAREQYLYHHCAGNILTPVSGSSKTKVGRLMKSVNLRFSQQLFLFRMTEDPKSRRQTLLNMLVKPYVWPEGATLPRNNFVYLAATQWRWLGMILTNRMTPGGRVRGKKPAKDRT